jgi:hypothetical protein
VSIEFDPHATTFQERAEIAEQLLRSLSNAVEGFARDSGGQLPHRLNLPHCVAQNHLRVLDLVIGDEA